MSTAKKKPAKEEPSLEYVIMHAPWFRRLNELQKRWVSNTEENKSAYESLMSETMIYAYMGCMQLAEEKYRGDEFVCSKAMDWVISDLKRYDPDKQSLGKFVSARIRFRLDQAYARIKEKQSIPAEPLESNAWYDVLDELEQCFPENLKSGHARWVEEVHRATYEEYWRHFKAFPRERRNMMLAAVKAVIAQYRPGEQSLVEFMEEVLPGKVRTLLKAPKPKEKSEDSKPEKQPRIPVVQVSIYGGDGEDESGEIEIPDGGVHVDEKVALREEAGAAILALVLNFINLKKKHVKEDGEEDGALWHYRMFYTEQITGAAKIMPLPEQWAVDILKAFHRSYFHFFMSGVDEAQPFTLQTIRMTKPKRHGEVIPGKKMDEYVPWDKDLFLPAKVQILYLQETRQKSVSASTVSERRKKYRESLMALHKREKE